MIKKLTACALLVCTQAQGNAESQCDPTTLGKDSFVFQVNSFDLKPTSTNGNTSGNTSTASDESLVDARQAKEAVLYYVKNKTNFTQKCNIDRDLDVRWDARSCRVFGTILPITNSCYLESNLGFFVVIKDYFDVFNITFVRWD
jgi:hypothetical protein